MLEVIDQANAYLWTQIEDALTPRAENSNESFAYHVAPLALLPIAFAANWLAIGKKLASYLFFSSSSSSSSNPNEDFTQVVNDASKWEQLDPLEVQLNLGFLNPNFLFGTATCTYQDSGSMHCPDSQWAKWEETCISDPTNRSNQSASFFALYQTKEGRAKIIEKLQKLHVNSYCLSIVWSHIEPQAGQLNKQALDVYVNLCKDLRKAGISPMVTLHHFSEPHWFHELGSFENEENIWHFVKFCEYIYPALTSDFQGKPLVEHICTINEPGIEAFSRYVRGAFSPGYFLNFFKAGLFLKGALKAHVVAYNRLKEINPKVQIGVTHQFLHFQYTNPLLFPFTYYLNRLINETVLHFFESGDFEYKMPLSFHIVEKNLQPKTDFVGLQYYVRPVIGFTGPTSFHSEKMTQMPFHEDPEGIYSAICESYKAFKAPIIVTESGISTHDEEQRARYMERVLFSIQKAAEKIGEQNVVGYYQWSICDNFEWDMGMEPQAFGAYILQNGQLSDEPKEGMRPFIELARRWQERNQQAKVA